MARGESIRCTLRVCSIISQGSSVPAPLLVGRAAVLFRGALRPHATHSTEVHSINVAMRHISSMPLHFPMIGVIV